MGESERKLVLHVPERGARDFPLRKKQIVIGRDPDADIPVNDRKVSRAHAQILEHDGGFTLRDLGSRNGTYLNDHKIDAEDGEVSIGEGDRIRLGSHIIQCVLPGVASGRAADAGFEQEKTDLVANMRARLLEIPDVPEEETAAAEQDWPPTPDDESPGDEIDTGGISALNIPRPTGEPSASQSVDLDLRDSEIDAIRAEEPVVKGGDTEYGAVPELGAELKEEVAAEARASRQAESMGADDTDAHDEPDSGYDVTADIEELRAANARFVIYGEDDSESQAVIRRKVTVGRGRHNDIVIVHHTVSSVHAEVHFGKDGFEVVDKNSTNGTYVENARVRQRRLTDGSYVMFGGVMSLFLHELDGGEKRDKAARIAEVLVRSGALPRERLEELQERARDGGLRLSELLVIERDVSPGQWWEASRMAGYGDPAEKQLSILVPLAIIVTLVLGLLVGLYMFLLQ